MSNYSFQEVYHNNYVYVCWLEPRMNFSSVPAHTVKTLMQMINGAPRTIQTGLWWAVWFFSNLHVKRSMIPTKYSCMSTSFIKAEWKWQRSLLYQIVALFQYSNFYCNLHPIYYCFHW